MVDGAVFVMIKKKRVVVFLRYPFYLSFMKLLEKGNVIEGCVSVYCTLMARKRQNKRGL